MTINPAEARGAGAMWCVDGGKWRASGETISGLSVGTHVVSFKDIEGDAGCSCTNDCWVTPADRTVNIASEDTTEVVATYERCDKRLATTLDARRTGDLGVFLVAGLSLAFAGQVRKRGHPRAGSR